MQEIVIFFAKSYEKIWSYQKKAVPLQPISLERYDKPLPAEAGFSD